MSWEAWEVSRFRPSEMGEIGLEEEWAGGGEWAGGSGLGESELGESGKILSMPRE